jgi:hypothetical protein
MESAQHVLPVLTKKIPCRIVRYYGDIFEAELNLNIATVFSVGYLVTLFVQQSREVKTVIFV